jgi:hypothetical protein
MFSSKILKLRALQSIQIILIIACFITFMQVESSTWFMLFAFASGWVLGDFLQTLKPNKNKNDE